MVIDKTKKYICRFFKQQIVRENYPMLTALSRLILSKEKVLGVVYMLHHITEKDEKRIPTNEDLKVSPSFLDKLIKQYKKKGFDFISLDQLYDIIISDNKPKRPFISITIDDGYLDNYTKALPIFERHQVPFAIFVATDFIDKKAILWWDTIEDLILKNDSITINDGNRYPCETFSERWDTFRLLREKILSLDQSDLIVELDKMFKDYQIDWYQPIKHQAMSWSQIKELSHHPLCTIGSHTISHPALSKLSEEDADNEIRNSIYKIEGVIEKPIKYFAYPYGTSLEVGEREYNLILNNGIKMSFLSHAGCITVENKNHITHLPRVYLHET